MFIAIDGPDGAGKTTIAKLLVSYYKEKVNYVKYFHMAEYRYFSEILGKINTDKTVPKYVREIIYYFEATKLSIEVIPQYVNVKDNVVVFDRYYLSYLSYGVENGMRIEEIEFFLSSLPSPDFYFYIDILPEVALERVKKMRNIDSPEVGFGNENTDYNFISFQNKIRQNYINFCDEKVRNVYIVDGNQSLNQNFERIIKVIGV